MKSLGIALKIDEHLEEMLDWAVKLGFGNCQLQIWNMENVNERHAEKVRRIAESFDMEITGLWCGWHGPIRWNFTEGPSVLGIVPPEYRATRTRNLLDGAAYGRVLGVKDIITHLGFIPLNCRDVNYTGVVNTVRYIAEELARHGQNLLMETGQEPPVVLKRLIQDVGSANLYVNYDPANLMMYGNANPVDGLGILGEYVRSIHAKDGSYPVDGYELGQEYPIGKGQVDFPRFVEKLKAIHYDGSISIEYEIEEGNERQRLEMEEGKRFLEKILYS